MTWWTRHRDTWSTRVRRARRHRPVEIAWCLVTQWRRHRSGRHVTLIGYFSFVSVFPLLLAFASGTVIVTDLLDWDVERLSASVVAQIPLVGDEVRRQAGTVSGSIVSIVGGGLVALWAANRAFLRVFDMNDDVWEVADDERLGFARRRAHGFLGMLVVGVGVVGATVMTSAVTVIGLPLVGDVAGVIIALAANTGVMFGLLQLCSRRLDWTRIRPGAVFGGVALWLLQVFGTNAVQWTVGTDQGPFAPTFLLIAWLTLHAGAITLAAELNHALAGGAEGGSAPAEPN